MKAEDKLEAIDKIICAWFDNYADDKDIEHGILAAIFAVMTIEEDNDGAYCATDISADSMEQEG